jgi:hypothetical protein
MDFCDFAFVGFFLEDFASDMSSVLLCFFTLEEIYLPDFSDKQITSNVISPFFIFKELFLFPTKNLFVGSKKEGEGKKEKN